MALYRFH